MTRATDVSILLRGALETLPEGELLRRAAAGPLRVKFGADPTAPDLHFGHLVVLRKLRQFQDLGHTVVFIIGDFTARVGDPSGRNSARPPLDSGAIDANAKTYMDQVFLVLDRNKTEIVRNSDWFSKMNFADVLRLAAQQTIAQVIHRRDFHDRVESGGDVFLHEFLYPLMQGYDSVMVRADVEIGGGDQKFNLLVGRDLQEKARMIPQVILTLPLLVGTDGKQKMSKTCGNYIAFRDSPENIYGKIMSIPDDALWDYWILLTDRPRDEIQSARERCQTGSENPRDVKAELARRMVSFFHDPPAADHAESHFRSVIVQKEAPADIQEVRLTPSDTGDLPTLLVKTGLVPSKGEARRMIEQGAVYMNGIRQEDKTSVHAVDGDVIKVGKRRFIRIRII